MLVRFNAQVLEVASMADVAPWLCHHRSSVVMVRATIRPFR
jgi:hypothetical protein